MLDNNNNMDSKEDSQNFTKTWVIEWTSSAGESSSGEHKNYYQALEIFNEKSKGGGDAILYEIHKSVSDGSIMKTIPVLNTKKAKKRKEETAKTNRVELEKEK